ncbi:MAG: branched-chain amino acid aminotransferase [Clostridiales bacterium]|nr:branched-chain amino acid aminotransferase [Clostridiales bacterium]MCD7753860.1 branched-chain amino acid aminotransferase [Clostridiales bacterium]MCD7802439.1 branched-chain amino acid aminotransferase [Clostridiales bacterium]
MDIRIELTKTPKEKPTDESALGFGKIFTDHMFLMNYTDGQGWHDARIVPYGPIALDPSAMVLHYAQEVFEGMKAYRIADGSIQLFRPYENARRFNNSAKRLCIPTMDEEMFVTAVKTLVNVDRDWVPHSPETSLYIRPFVFATDPHLGVHASKTYLFAIIVSPSGCYYPEGINPVRIYVESKDVRAVRGGTGYTKCGGNYAASIRAGEVAEEKGYTQVLWLDGVEQKYIEEVGSMNVMFKISGKIVTPALTGSVLPGITRKSCIELLKSWGYEVEERLLSAQELFDAAESGALEEAWGTGTAAVVSPVGEMAWNDRTCIVNGGKIGPTVQKLYDTLTGIQWGKLEDTFGWIVKVD